MTRRFTILPFRLLAGCVLLALLAMPARATDYAWADLEGQQHRLSDYRGKWVLVNYWATWCPPCLEELPELESFHSGSDGRATVLGVNTESIDGDELRAFVDGQALSYPILRSRTDPAASELIGPIEGLPTSYLVTPDGEVVARQVGPITAQAIMRFIDGFEAKKGTKK